MSLKKSSDHGNVELFVEEMNTIKVSVRYNICLGSETNSSGVTLIK